MLNARVHSNVEWQETAGRQSAEIGFDAAIPGGHLNEAGLAADELILKSCAGIALV